MRALITGASGFVGGHLAEHLVAQGDSLLGCSNRGSWPQDIADAVRLHSPIFAWDLTTGISDEAKQRIEEFSPEVIYHLAAISVPSDCGADLPTLSAIAANVEGTRTIISLARALACPPRIVFSSSCYVYGPVPISYPFVSENSPCHPEHGYGITKLAAERELLACASSIGLDVVIARAFQHSGPRQSPQMILPDWARQLASKQRPIRVICLDTFLDIGDVRDVVRAYRSLCLSGTRGGVYNVGTGRSQRAGDLLEWMLGACGATGMAVELSPGRRQHPIADISRIRRDTNWEPVIPIEQTLGDIVQYWMQREAKS